MLKGIHPVLSPDLIRSYAAMLAPRSREGFGGIMLKCRHVFHLPPHQANVRSREKKVRNSE